MSKKVRLGIRWVCLAKQMDGSLRPWRIHERKKDCAAIDREIIRVRITVVKSKKGGQDGRTKNR